MRISFQISGIIFMPQNCISFVCRCWKSSNRIAKGARLWITSVAKVARIVVWNNHSYSEQNSYHQAPWSMDTQSCSLYFGAYYTSTTLKHFCPSTSLFLVKSAATGWGKVCRIVNVGGSRFFFDATCLQTIWWKHSLLAQTSIYWKTKCGTSLVYGCLYNTATDYKTCRETMTDYCMGKVGKCPGPGRCLWPWPMECRATQGLSLWTRPLMWTGRAVSFTLKQRSMPVWSYVICSAQIAAE